MTTELNRKPLFVHTVKNRTEDEDGNPADETWTLLIDELDRYVVELSHSGWVDWPSCGVDGVIRWDSPEVIHDAIKEYLYALKYNSFKAPQSVIDIAYKYIKEKGYKNTLEDWPATTWETIEVPEGLFEMEIWQKDYLDGSLSNVVTIYKATKTGKGSNMHFDLDESDGRCWLNITMID